MNKIKLVHNKDGGELEQVGISWVGSAPNPEYRCKLCGALITASSPDRYTEKTPEPTILKDVTFRDGKAVLTY